MNSYENAHVLCPFFKNISRNKNQIHCEGIKGTEKLTLSFKTIEKRKQFGKNFCEDKCWQGCLIAQMLENEYEEK